MSGPIFFILLFFIGLLSIWLWLMIYEPWEAFEGRFYVARFMVISIFAYWASDFERRLIK